ncbi:hypothetical protein OH76DRAFT_137369 [Lentinus brumalis]|uniref:F-box domain-containing protein n=1 Tax=Lentinus brumalis TaxID=2498619 RepID=A0A371CPP6_9APHY|nr:hypothetical protein OH76DRAFT_137369 [Polyporus brumalis]
MLRTLRLSFVQIPFDAIALSKLHCLSIGGHVFDSSVTYADIMNVLQRCVELKELRLHRMLSQPIRQFPLPVISLNLPRLRKLVIWDLPSFTSPFLSGIHLSPEVTLRVCHQLPPSFSIARIPRGFASFLPADFSDLPILRSVTTGSIDCWQEHDVVLKGTFRDATITLKMIETTSDNVSFYLHDALQQFHFVFAGAPIKKLELSGDLDSVPSIDDYRSFLDGFPTLQTIAVRGPGSPLVFLLALLRESPDFPPNTLSERADTGSDRQSSEPFVCPELRSLTIEYVECQQVVIEVLVTILRRRIDRGLPKLEELVLALPISKSCNR